MRRFFNPNYVGIKLLHTSHTILSWIDFVSHDSFLSQNMRLLLEVLSAHYFSRNFVTSSDCLRTDYVLLVKFICSTILTALIVLCSFIHLCINLLKSIWHPHCTSCGYDLYSYNINSKISLSSKVTPTCRPIRQTGRY